MAEQGKAEKITFSEEQQALVDKLVGDARTKARTKAEADEAAKTAKDKTAADQAAMAASKEWQKLAQMHETRVKELEPLMAQAEAYGKLISGMLRDRVKALGDEAKKAIDALPEGMSAPQKLEWLNKNEGLFQAASDGVGTPKRPMAVTGKPSTPGKVSKTGTGGYRL